MDHQNPSQERQQQNQNQNQNQNQPRRRPMEAAVAAGGDQNLPHPPPQTCPRCNSNNTKFCYYNNYSLAQPRYFCKGCRRYWTHGGTLRNVPVGGGSRKRKRPKLTSSSATAANAATAITRSLQEPPFEQSSHLNNNRISQNPSTSLLGTPISGASTFYSGGFLASLSEIPAINFGSNLGLLHGLGLPNLDHNKLPHHHQQQHHQQQQQQQEPLMSFQQLLHHHHHQNLHPSLVSTLPGAPSSSSGDWILSTTTTTNNNDSNNSNKSNNDPDLWPDFQVGNTGLEDP